MSQWWLIACIIFLLVVSMLTTIVFCFWFIYLIDAIFRKGKIYKNTKRDMYNRETLMLTMKYISLQRQD